VGCLFAMSQNCFASKPKTLLIGVMQSGTELHHQVLSLFLLFQSVLLQMCFFVNIFFFV
jgi:hypothetical protein